MSLRRHQHQPILREGHGLQFGGGIDDVGHDAEIGPAARDGAHDVRARAVLDLDVDIGMGRQESADQRRQEFQGGGRVRQHAHLAAQALGELAKFSAHLVELPGDQPCVMEEGEAGRSRADAAPLALEQRHAQFALHVAHALAGGGQGKAAAGRAVGDARGLGDVQHQAQVDQVEVHGSI